MQESRIGLAARAGGQEKVVVGRAGRRWTSGCSLIALAMAEVLAATGAHAQSAGVAATPAAAATKPAAPADPAKTSKANVSEVQEIIVTGIRGAIIQGLESKRDAEIIVESIKSEEIGKFPDKNLAEALQRIPGVSIDRDGGEGRYVTIRGLGPQFNTVLLNGRRIATDNYNRSFSFDTISSDLVAGINVYKTQQSYIREGGIGGTVDVRTTRPLDHPGLHGAARVEGLYEENSKQTTPNGSALISDTFLDDTLGFQVSVSRQERNNRTYTLNTDAGSGIRSQDAFTAYDPVDYPAIFAYSNFGVNPVYRQQQLNRDVIDEHRVRTGLTAAGQWKPSDRLEVNVDYLYSNFKTDTTINQVSNWIWTATPPKSAAPAVLAYGQANDPANIAQWTAFANYIAANSKTQLDKNGVATTIDINPNSGLIGFNTEVHHRPTVTQMAGLNLAYKVSDDIDFTLDGAWSKARDNDPGLDMRRSMEIKDTGKYLVDATGSVPEILNLDPRMAATYANATNLNVRRQYNTGDVIDAQNYEISGEFKWRISDKLKVRFGGLREVDKKSLLDYATDNQLQQEMYQNSGYKFASVAELQSVVYGILATDPSKFGQNKDAYTTTFAINIPAFDAYMANPANLARLRQIALANNDTARLASIDAFIKNGSSFAATLTGNSANVREAVTSAYADFDADFQILDRPAHLTGGLRYTRTETDAGGYAQVLTNLTPLPTAPGNNPNTLIPTFATANGPGGLTSTLVSTHYDDWLPSVNFKMDITHDVILRLAASKSLTRPELDDLTPKFSYGSFSKSGSTVTTNNPKLQPTRSNNYDASLEWYPAQATSLGIDVFQKDIQGFIVQQTISGQKVASLPTTSSGDYQTSYNNFTFIEPANAGDVRVRGVTVAWTQSFEFGGGFQMNYTWVDTNRPFDPSNYDPTKVTLPGLSNTLNVVGFFERGPFQARVAYNRRSSFLVNPNYCGGEYCSAPEPLIANPYDQVDARLGYTFWKTAQVYVEGINLTKSVLTEHGRFENLFISRENFGRRFTLGVSARF